MTEYKDYYVGVIIALYVLDQDPNWFLQAYRIQCIRYKIRGHWPCIKEELSTFFQPAMITFSDQAWRVCIILTILLCLILSKMTIMQLEDHESFTLKSWCILPTVKLKPPDKQKIFCILCVMLFWVGTKPTYLFLFSVHPCVVLKYISSNR